MFITLGLIVVHFLLSSLKPSVMSFNFLLLSNIMEQRMAFITGQIGGGKTSLAFLLAAYIFRSNIGCDKLCTNVKSVIDTSFDSYNTIFLVDEADRWVSYKDGDGLYTYLRKRGNFVILVSAGKIPQSVEDNCYTISYNFQMFWLGIPLTVYWVRQPGQKGKKKKPSRIYVFNIHRTWPFFDSSHEPSKMASALVVEKMKTNE